MSRGDQKPLASDGEAVTEYRKLLSDFQASVKAGKGDQWKKSQDGIKFEGLKKRFTVG